MDEKELAKELAKQIEEDLVKMIYSELSLSAMLNKKLEEQIHIEPETEYQQDSVFYMNRLWWSMPYPKGSGFIGFVNITS